MQIFAELIQELILKYHVKEEWKIFKILLQQQQKTVTLTTKKTQVLRDFNVISIK